MDLEIVRDQHTSPDQQTTPEQKIAPKHQTTSEQQTAIEQEPNSDNWQVIPPDQITQEGNEACLREHQRHLRTGYPSGDMSEVSYHTEHTDFPGSRHSSLNTEPLTLDAEQIHEAKDQAVDVIQRVDSDVALDIFTKESLKTIAGRVSMMEYYWRHGQQDLQITTDEAPSQESELQALADQINSLVEKSQQVVEANVQRPGRKISGAASVSVEEKKGQEDFVASVEEDAKLKAD